MRTYTPLVLLFFSTVAQAQQMLPNMVGTWQGKSEVIMRGQAPHYTPPAKGSTVPRLSQSDITFTIISQEGRRFWGTVGIGGSKETLMGAIGFDRQTLYMVDQDGFADGQLVDPNTADICYRHVNTLSAIVSCVELKRMSK